jgi:hypothetical protein
MRWFRRRPERAWSRHVTSGKPITPMREPPPTPRELVSVVGIGQTETVNGVALTLLSLERYREADIVTFRLTHRRGMHLDFPSPELFITVTTGDDSPVRRISMMGGAGGGNGQELVFRYSYSFAPPIPENATEVVIEVSKIEWARYGRNERKIASVEVGPWRFTIKP